ncbi:MAG: helix-turn-helix domain-containing protein, partial [Actinomycetaceae bacterium]|nr:helix-turn-helix domain-containing protein [Actinomycetaceae bacterium]
MNLDLRSQNAQRTRVAIRTAAIDLALERGYAAMTIDDVAQRAGVSRRTVFNYFPTKADLVVGGIPSPSERAVERFVAGGGNLLHDLRDLLADAYANVPGAERYAAKMPVLLRDNPELNPVLHERVRIFADRIRCFAAQRLRLEESDPRVRALVDVAGMINRSALDLWSRAEEDGYTGCDRAAAIAAVTDSLERLFTFDAALQSATPEAPAAEGVPEAPAAEDFTHNQENHA